MLVSTTISAQAYNCGLFGMITDDYGQPYVGRFDNLKKWIEWKPYTNMEILSVIPGPIDNHIPSINFEQALEIDSETNN